MRVYLDTCCLNRPFDDQSQERVRHESEAVLRILARLLRGEWTWVASEMLEAEVNAIQDIGLRGALGKVLRRADESVRLTSVEANRAAYLARFNIKPLDARHIACAESGRSDVFLTTDDRLLASAARAGSGLAVRVLNPLQWLEEMHNDNR